MTFKCTVGGPSIWLMSKSFVEFLKMMMMIIIVIIVIIVFCSPPLEIIAGKRSRGE